MDVAVGHIAADLVQRAAQGDAEAFDAIARAFGDPLYRRAFAILRDDADARDATQEALVRAWRELPRLRDAARLDAWLDRILVNVCRDQLRRRGRQEVREIRPTITRAAMAGLVVGPPIRMRATIAALLSRQHSGGCPSMTGPCWSSITSSCDPWPTWLPSWLSRSGP